MRRQAKEILRKLDLERVGIEVWQTLRRKYWQTSTKLGREKRIVRKYLSTHEVHKLHLGCGGHILPGWLNTDLYPETPAIARLDVTRPFPFQDGVFDNIYTEHMIEHIPYAQGFQMLQECYRVLKSDGTLRVCTPNLAFLIGLYKPDKSDTEKRYIKETSDIWIKFAPYYDEVFVINNFVRDWGHQFIYDERTLATALRKAGFTRIVRLNLNESQEEALRNLENEERYPEGLLRLETLTLEAKK